MKLMRSNLMGLLLMAVAMFSVSCDDDIETSSLTLDQTQEATISAYLYAELDKTNLGLEKAPNGTKVFVSVNNSEFNSGATGSWIDTVYVQNGMIQSVVPVTSSGVTVRITPADFVQNQVQPYNSTSETLSKIFKVDGGSEVENVKPGENRVHEIKYAYEALLNEQELVERSFTIKAITNVDDGIKEVGGVTITFYNSEWSEVASSTPEGLVKIKLPKNKSDIKAVFTFNKFWESGSLNRKLHLYEVTLSSFTVSSPVASDLNFSGGTLYE